jgi:predicted site-specific integrase-resolvase
VPINTTDKLLTTQEAAHRRGVTDGRIRQYVRDGLLRPAAIVGKNLLFREVDVVSLPKFSGGRPSVRDRQRARRKNSSPLP